MFFMDFHGFQQLFFIDFRGFSPILQDCSGIFADCRSFSQIFVIDFHRFISQIFEDFHIDEHERAIRKPTKLWPFFIAMYAKTKNVHNDGGATTLDNDICQWHQLEMKWLLEP